MNTEEINNLVNKIKQSKKYKTLSEEIIKKEAEDFIRKNKDWERCKEKFILKQIKAKLHKAYSGFQFSNKSKINKEREELLEELRKEPKNLGIINKILLTNKSTKERLAFYEELYEKIFEITGKPEIIVDLGCGLNPVSFSYMNLEKEKINYYAYDIDEKDVDFLNGFFNIMKDKINGKAESIDAREIENIKNMPSCDVCFMFKLIDVLEKQEKGHKLAEKIIKTLIENKKCKFIVASFSTLTLSGNKMNFPYRGWIERMLSRINLRFERIEFENEIFYVISCNK